MVKHSLLTHNHHEMIILYITSGPFQAIYDFHSSLKSKSLSAFFSTKMQAKREKVHAVIVDLYFAFLWCVPKHC